MKFSKRALIKLKNKNKKLKSDKYKNFKRQIFHSRIKGTIERPRLSVYHSNQNVYAQIIDDINSKTLISCSTFDISIRLALIAKQNNDVYKLIGKKLAQLSLKKNIIKIVFDRGPYIYHGHIKILADTARTCGLQF